MIKWLDGFQHTASIEFLRNCGKISADKINEREPADMTVRILSETKKARKRPSTGPYAARKIKDGRHGEVWEIYGPQGTPPQTVVTSTSTAVVLDEITATYSKALKRLAKK